MVLDHPWMSPSHICELVCHGDLHLWIILNFDHHHPQERNFLKEGHRFLIVLETFPRPRLELLTFQYICSDLLFLLSNVVGNTIFSFSKACFFYALLMAFSNLFIYILTFDTKMQLKRKSGSHQSWNIQDEIRKVRVKATEEMLKSPSSVASLNLDGSVKGVFSFFFMVEAASILHSGYK